VNNLVSVKKRTHSLALSSSVLKIRHKETDNDREKRVAASSNAESKERKIVKMEREREKEQKRGNTFEKILTFFSPFFNVFFVFSMCGGSFSTKESHRGFIF